MSLDRYLKAGFAPAAGAPQPPAAPAGKTLLIAACSATKLDRPAPAGELYCGAAFRKAQLLAQQQGWDFRIVSAKHGLVEPGQVLAPYNLKLQGMAARSAIQPQVLAEAKKLWPRYAKVVLVMGAEYRKLFAPLLGRSHSPEALAKLRRPRVELIDGGQGEMLHALTERTGGPLPRRRKR